MNCKKVAAKIAAARYGVSIENPVMSAEIPRNPNIFPNVISFCLSLLVTYYVRYYTQVKV